MREMVHMDSSNELQTTFWFVVDSCTAYALQIVPNVSGARWYQATGTNEWVANKVATEETSENVESAAWSIFVSLGWKAYQKLDMCSLEQHFFAVKFCVYRVPNFIRCGPGVCADVFFPWMFYDYTFLESWSSFQTFPDNWIIVSD